MWNGKGKKTDGFEADGVKYIHKILKNKSSCVQDAFYLHLPIQYDKIPVHNKLFLPADGENDSGSGDN